MREIQPRLALKVPTAGALLADVIYTLPAEDLVSIIVIVRVRVRVRGMVADRFS